MQTIIKTKGLIDVNSAGVIPQQYVTVQGTAISAVGPLDNMPAPDPDTDILDCRDQYILPGLVNCHAHTGTFYGKDDADFEDFANYPHELLAMAAARNVQAEVESGVTTLRDCSGHNGVVFSLRTAIEKALVMGPRLVASGRCLTIPEGHCHFIGIQVDGPDNIARVVRQQIEAGADFIKIMATGGGTKGTLPGQASFSVPEITAACEAAHRLGKNVSAHCRGIPGIRNAIEGGVDHIEHADFELPDGRLAFDPLLAEKIADRKIYVTPTIQLYRDLVVAGQRNKARGNLSAAEEKYLSVLQQALDEKFRAMEGLLQAGVQCVAGNDAGLPNTPFGGFWRELDAMVKGGMTPIEALTAGTRTGAEAMGLFSETGSIEAGKQADIIAVDQDPTVDIAALGKVSMVMRAGKVCKKG
ncbi:MAG: amidohydrolase family protein [Thermodesulfobacteriota bacterium]